MLQTLKETYHVAKVTDTDTHATRKTIPVSRICFALNNSKSSRRKKLHSNSHIFRQYATSEPRATLVDTVPVHATAHLCWQSRYRLTGGKRGGDRVGVATSKHVRRRQACTPRPDFSARHASFGAPHAGWRRCRMNDATPAAEIDRKPRLHPHSVKCTPVVF